MDRARDRKIIFVALAVTLGVALHVDLPCAHAEIPAALEPRFSEAVLALNGKNYDLALKILDQLLLAAPGTAEFLELKALAFKHSQDSRRSAETYLKLISQRQAAGGSLKDVAPYFFELGVLAYQAKTFDRARESFRQSIRGGFNPEASHFFLGLMALAEQDPETAEEHFSLVLETAPDELKASAWYSRAQAASLRADSAAAALAYQEAQTLAGETLKRGDLSPEALTLLRSLSDHSMRALTPLEKTTAFGNLSLFSGYVSDVLTSPPGTTSAIPSGLGSVQTLVSGGIGLFTSPLRPWQFVVSYRAGLTIQGNRAASAGDFFTHTLSLHLNRDPLAKTVWGLKVDGTLILQGALQGMTRAFSGLSIGPYFKSRTTPTSWWTAELFVTPQDFASDGSASASSRRSGLKTSAKLTLQSDARAGLWNPQVFLQGFSDATIGTDFQAWGVGSGAGTTAYFGRSSVALNVGFLWTSYFAKTPSPRFDRNVSGELLATHPLSNRLTILGTLSTTFHSSSETSGVSYTQVLGSAGLSLSLF